MATARLRGRLVRATMNPGTKSESPGFVLVTPGGDRIAVEKREDNPFEPASLEPYADREVDVSGELYRGRFLVDVIRSIDD